MSVGVNETEIRYWTDYANRDGICFRKEDAHMLVHEHYEFERIKAENAKLWELVRAQMRLTCAVHEYWADAERPQHKLDEVLAATRRVNKLCDELGIEVG